MLKLFSVENEKKVKIKIIFVCDTSHRLCPYQELLKMIINYIDG